MKKQDNRETKLEDKLKNLIQTSQSLEKRYGEGILMQLGKKDSARIESFSSGSLLLDEALGVGGYPRGRIIEIYGPESSGKTTMALHAIAEMQKINGLCVFIDAEHALDVSYASAIGVNTDMLYISQPENGEQALDIADELIYSHSVDLIVIDSVAALVPKAEIQGDMGDPQVALQARLMSQAMRKITGSLSKSKTTIIFINQLRMKVGSFYGPQETTTGGMALKFYSSIRLDVRRGEILRKGDKDIGNKIKLRVVKNKVSPPFRKVETTLIYGSGVSRIHEVIELAVQHAIIKKSGSWFSYADRRLAQGVDNVKDFLLSETSLLKEIEQKIYDKLQLMKSEKIAANKNSDKKKISSLSPATSKSKDNKKPDFLKGLDDVTDDSAVNEKVVF